MFAHWMHDIESLEAISQDHDTRRLFLRMASLSQEGRLGAFLCELADDADLDTDTKGVLSALAQDEAFVLVVQEYLRRTQIFH
jgi:hypothetical protein